MQDSNRGSTLELVVNEQQMHNMSQIDLRPYSTDANQQTTAKLNSYLTQSEASQQQEQQVPEGNMLSFDALKSWPSRFRESFQTKLDEAKAKSETKTEYVIEVIQAFSETIIWILCFIGTIIIPIICFFIGLANLDNCESARALPYLVFGIGFCMTASNLFNLALAFDVPVLANHKFLTIDVKNIIASLVNIMFNCVVVFLYIVSAYMVYNIKEGYDCDETLYKFTFWFITLTLGVSVVLIILASLLFGYNRYRMAIIRGSTPRPHQSTNSPTNTNNNNQT